MQHQTPHSATSQDVIPASFPNWMRSNRVGFLAAGFAIAAWAPIIPYIKARFGLDEHGLGLLLLCVGSGSLFSSPLAGFLTARLGCKIPIFAAATLWALCLVLISVLESLPLLIVVLVLFGLAAVILEVVSNINGAMIEQVTGRTIMSGLHARYSLGGLIGSFGVTSLLGANLAVPTAAGISAAFLVVMVLWRGRSLFNQQELHPEQYQAPSTNASACAAVNADARGSANTAAAAPAPDQAFSRRYVLHPTVLMISFMLFVLYLTEGAMLDWSSVFLVDERAMPLEQAGYGYAAFAIMMTSFRFIGDRIVLLMGRRRVIVLGTMLICLGFILAALIDHAYCTIASFALIGIGSSNVIPQLVSYVAKVKEVPMSISVTVVNSLGFTGVLLGPAIIGFLAHLITLHLTFIVLGVFILSVTALSLRYLRQN
ncbi:MAG TPA: MFS transporter [Candidatus Anaerobiospirillum stercoravium]|nr:MFS transporter [Candidatus Anaerobiospirillum stercoravium]